MPTPSTWATRSARSTRPMPSRMPLLSVPDDLEHRRRHRSVQHREPDPHLASERDARRQPRTTRTTPRWTTPAQVLGTHPTYPPHAGLDVRLTQLRNLLAGTRPQTNPFSPDTTGLTNGDANIVYGSWSGGASATLLPAQRDRGFRRPAAADDLQSPMPEHGPSPGRAHDHAGRRAVGRGRVHPRRAVLQSRQHGTPFNLVQTNYANPVRAGYSFDVTDLLRQQPVVDYDANGDPIFPRDAADDNYNAFDVFPPRAHRRGRRRRLLRRRRRAAAPGRADAAVRDAGRHQRHRARGPVHGHAPTAVRSAAARTWAPTTTAASSSPATSGRPGRRA